MLDYDAAARIRAEQEHYEAAARRLEEQERDAQATARRDERIKLAALISVIIAAGVLASLFVFQTITANNSGAPPVPSVRLGPTAQHNQYLATCSNGGVLYASPPPDADLWIGIPDPVNPGYVYPVYRRALDWPVTDMAVACADGTVMRPHNNLPRAELSP